MLIVPHPRNESNEHFEMKCIARLLLKHKGCQVSAFEVSGFYDKLSLSYFGKKKSGILDVAGAKMGYGEIRENPSIKTYGFEAKASLADYKNGFNAGTDLTYVIAPKGMLSLDIIPTGIGLYEVDLNNYGIDYKQVHYGIELVKQATNRHKRRHYRTKLKHMIYIAQRATNMDLYKTPRIILHKE